LKHKEAATVLDYFWTDLSVPAQKYQMVYEFYGPEFTLFKVCLCLFVYVCYVCFFFFFGYFGLI